MNRGNTDLYTVSFINNAAANGKRADLAVNGGTVIVHPDCPSDRGGSATSEFDLEIHVESRLGVISGPSQSFKLGSCDPSDR